MGTITFPAAEKEKRRGKANRYGLSARYLKALFFKGTGAREKERKKATCAYHRKYLLYTLWCLRKRFYPELLAGFRNHKGGNYYCTARLLETATYITHLLWAPGATPATPLVVCKYLWKMGHCYSSDIKCQAGLQIPSDLYKIQLGGFEYL